MNRLYNSICYLSGPMDHVPDNGVGWRRDITPKLWSMGIGVFNPCDKPNDEAPEDSITKKTLSTAQDNQNYDVLVPFCKKIVGVDLRMVHLSSFLIAYIDKDSFIFGTSIEIAWAVQQRKPVLTIIKQGKQYAPKFMFGMIPSQEIFNNFDEAMIYIKSVDNGSIDVSNLRRWHFFDYKKVYGR